MPLLEIDNLHVCVEGTPILKGLSLTIEPGQVHSIMGPNGSGKSTLSQVLAGHEAYEVTQGTIRFEGRDLSDFEPHERAHLGLFLAFQYPVEIPGVSNTQFLRSAYNALRKARGEDELDAMAFLKLAREKAQLVQIDQKFLKRSVNEGFSGGEKKRNEIFQMALLEPKFAILDETDSGLDIDALKIVSQGVNAMRDQNRSFLLITHYQRLLNYIVPDVVHVLVDGRIAETGDKDLALRLESEGYAHWMDSSKQPEAASSAG